MTSASDPSGLITNPPSTLVKIVRTSRDDLNGLFAIVTSYNAGRSRYMVQLLPGQQSPNQAAAAAAAARAAGGSHQQALSFKPENLVKAAFFEGAKAKAMVAIHQAQQHINNPQSREQLKRLYTSMDQKLPAQIKPEHAALGALLVWFIFARLMGFSKAVLLTSFVLLIGLIIAPDITNSNDPQSVARIFPMRLRQTIVRTTGYTNLTEKQALIGFAVLSLFVLKLLSTAEGGPETAAAMSNAASPPVASGEGSASNSFDIKEIYRLGFNDGKSGLEFGTSLPVDTVVSGNPEGVVSARGVDAPGDIAWPYDPSPPSAQSQRNSGLLGPFQFFVTNVKVQPPLKIALLGFCAYRVLVAFL